MESRAASRVLRRETFRYGQQPVVIVPLRMHEEWSAGNGIRSTHYKLCQENILVGLVCLSSKKIFGKDEFMRKTCYERRKPYNHLSIIAMVCRHIYITASVHNNLTALTAMANPKQSNYFRIDVLCLIINCMRF